VRDLKKSIAAALLFAFLAAAQYAYSFLINIKERKKYFESKPDGIQQLKALQSFGSLDQSCIAVYNDKCLRPTDGITETIEVFSFSDTRGPFSIEFAEAPDKVNSSASQRLNSGRK